MYFDKENTQYTCTWKLRTKHETSKQLLNYKITSHADKYLMCMFAHMGGSSAGHQAVPHAQIRSVYDFFSLNFNRNIEVPHKKKKKECVLVYYRKVIILCL